MRMFAAHFLALTLFLIISSLSLAVKPIFASGPAKIAKVNEFRASKGLPPVTINPLTCQFAAIRAREAFGNFNHDGFYNRVKNYTLPYPKYRLITENLAWAPNNQDAVNMWINSPSHAANLLKNTKYACVEKYGDYYAYEGLGA